MDNKTYTGTVQNIILDGKHGPYAVASTEELGYVTFSLDPKDWKEKRYPEGGSIVVLSEVSKKRAGWRANSGRFFQPSDEQLETGKYQHQQQKRRTEK